VPVLSDVVLFFNSIVVLPLNGQYLGYATVAFNGRNFCNVTVITEYRRPLKADLFYRGGGALP